MTLTPARFAARISSPETPDGPRSLPASDALCHRCHVVIVITTSLLLQQSLSERSSCMLVPWGMLLTYQIHCGQCCVIAGQMRKRRACTPHTHAARRRASARSRGAIGSLPLAARPAGAGGCPGGVGSAKAPGAVDTQRKAAPAKRSKISCNSQCRLQRFRISTSIRVNVHLATSQVFSVG